MCKAFSENPELFYEVTDPSYKPQFGDILVYSDPLGARTFHEKLETITVFSYRSYMTLSRLREERCLPRNNKLWRTITCYRDLRGTMADPRRIETPSGVTYTYLQLR
jgi:hypothetical protein